MDSALEKKINTLIAAYDNVVGGIDNTAMHSKDRAYGGIIRAGKGKLLEAMTAELVNIAWSDILKQHPSRLKINKDKMPVPTRSDYADRIKDERVKEYVRKHQKELVYKFGTDVQVFVDGKLVLPIECKTYTENAMLKRILFDAELMREVVGTDTYYLIQLESMLGGDYCELNDVTYGSPATHALLSHVDVDLEIITLLKGERKVDQPIHKEAYFKKLRAGELLKAIHVFANALSKYAHAPSGQSVPASRPKAPELINKPLFKAERPAETTKIAPKAETTKITPKTEKPAPPDTPKIYDGMTVFHKVFGDGVLKLDASGRVATVKFRTCVKQFVVPDCFRNGFLTVK